MPDPTNAASRARERTLRAELRELPALGRSFAYFFSLLCAYHVLRAVRNEVAMRASVARFDGCSPRLSWR